MRYLSVCSGIEAATVAWHPLGWQAAAFSEIEAFPRAVLKHHYPAVPLHGDFITIRGDEYGAIDLLVGGTPCQDFSVAGKRAGMDGDRGNLTLEYARLARRTRPRWLVWENVPGVFSLNGGRDFGAVIATFAGYPDGSIFEPPPEGWRSVGIVPAAGPDGYGLAWAVLDAQYFGLAQRRSRVFVVGYLGDWRRAAAVLLEREGLLGDPPPRREARKDVAPTLNARTKGGGGLGTDFEVDGGLIAPTLPAGGNETGGHRPPGTTADTADSLIVMASGQAGAEIVRDGEPSLTCLHEAPIVAHAFDARQSDVIQYGDRTGPLDTDGYSQAIAFDTTQITSPTNRSQPRAGDPSHPLAAGAHPPAIAFPILETGKRTGTSSTSKKAGDGFGREGDPSFTLGADSRHGVAFALRGREDGALPEVEGDGGRVGALRSASGGSSRDYVATTMVRRLTPRECERLQGFPDDYTLIPWRKGHAADGPRYKALGNSMAVPVMRWIGERIALVEDIARELGAAA